MRFDGPQIYDNLSTKGVGLTWFLFEKNRLNCRRFSRFGKSDKLLWQYMGRCNRVAQRACRVVADYNWIDIVATRRTYIIASRYVRHAAQIGRKIAKKPAGCSGGLAGIQRPLVGRRVNLTEVVDAGVSLRG